MNRLRRRKARQRRIVRAERIRKMMFRRLVRLMMQGIELPPIPGEER